MMFLLQTMRDLLEQQKTLAKDFNKAFDTRVTTIRETVASAKSHLAAVQSAIKTANEELESIKQRTAELPQVTAAPAAPAPAPPANITTFTPPPHPTHEGPKEIEKPVLRVLAMPREPETTGDLIDAWVGLDFAGDEPDPLGYDVPDIQPQAPQDADAARDAFRALLSMDADEPQRPSAKSPDQPKHRNGNGRPVPPIHARVYEYDEAGLSIAQIAQEMGIGKGEVRLILSLRKSKDT